MIKKYTSLAQIIDRYDAFIIDLWGVIHDGVEAYAGVNEALAEIKAAGKKTVFLSNAPRRAAMAVLGLQKVGVPDNLYDHILTSGEVTYEYIKAGAHGLGKKCFIMGPERDAGLLNGLDYEIVNSPQDADFVIVTGFEDDDSTMEEVMPDLETCLARGLLLICANPDYVIVRKSGRRALCAGAIAEQYDDMGGKIKQFGKPYKDVYQKCMSFVGDVDLSRIAAIGDNLDTDIKGANNFGVDSYLIAGGILGEALGIKHGEMPPEDKLRTICETSGNIPTGVLPAFVW